MVTVSRGRRGRGATRTSARVEWRSEGRWAERPAALWLDGVRVEVEVLDRWVEGATVAGGETRHCFVVGDGTGRSFRISHGSRSGTAVELLAPGAAPDGERGSTPGGET
jgi:hypothetical protein